jgi:spermidine synthase
MIYKVIDSSEVLTNGASELNKYNIYFVKGCLFISDENNTQDFYQNVKSVFNQSEIYEINENNLAYEPSHVIEWSKKELISADVIRYEKENQQKLRQIMQQLDNVEKELFEGSDSQCQRKSESAEDRPKTKSRSILMKVLNKLKCKINKM